MSSTTINGWPKITHPAPATFVAPNGKTVYVANADIAVLFEYVACRWHREVQALPAATHNAFPNERQGLIVIHASRPGDPGNTGGTSNHLSATACDINGHINHYEPFCVANICGGSGRVYHPGLNATQQARVRAICAHPKDTRGRSVMHAGLDFRVGQRDAMHFGIGTLNANKVLQHVSPARVREAALHVLPNRVRQLLPQVGHTATPGGVGRFQAQHGLTVDHMPGPITRAKLEEVAAPPPPPVTPPPPPPKEDDAMTPEQEAKLDALTRAVNNLADAFGTSDERTRQQLNTLGRQNVQIRDEGPQRTAIAVGDGRARLTGSSAEAFGDTFRRDALLAYAARAGYDQPAVIIRAIGELVDASEERITKALAHCPRLDAASDDAGHEDDEAQA